LLVHGNNHIRDELARTYRDGTREQLVAQSLKRIERLEQKLKLEIPKVMAPPHSACTEDLAGELLRQRYEALCISHEMLRRFNLTKEWPASFGLEPAEFLSGGLPVMPRFPFSNKSTNAAVLAGFLGQAIIPYGHHENMGDGLSFVTELTANINRMDGVEWSSLTRIARTNYTHRVSANTLQLQMYSRHIQVNVPKEIERVEVHRPWLGSDEAAESLEMCIDDDTWVQLENGEILLPRDIHVRRLDIRSVWLGSVDFHRIPAQSLAPWAIMRRLLTEIRDRCHYGGG